MLFQVRAADVFLDCFTYNAHTTAVDSLWGGKKHTVSSTLRALTCHAYANALYSLWSGQIFSALSTRSCRDIQCALIVENSVFLSSVCVCKGMEGLVSCHVVFWCMICVWFVFVSVKMHMTLIRWIAKKIPCQTQHTWPYGRSHMFAVDCIQFKLCIWKEGHGLHQAHVTQCIKCRQQLLVLCRSVFLLHCEVLTPSSTRHLMCNTAT